MKIEKSIGTEYHYTLYIICDTKENSVFARINFDLTV